MSRIRLVLAAAALLVAACEQPREAEKFNTVAITPFLGAPVLGNPNAPVTITEYASTTCGHCYVFHRDIFPELRAKYIDTGKAKLAYVVMPTPPAPISAAGGAIARCAGEAKFFDVIADLFENQQKIVEAAKNPWRLQKELRAVGNRHGLSNDQIGTCIDDKAVDGVTRQGVRDAPESVTGTPTFIVAGEEVPHDTLEAIGAAIDAQLGKVPVAAPAPR